MIDVFFSLWNHFFLSGSFIIKCFDYYIIIMETSIIIGWWVCFQVWVFNVVSMLKLHKAWVEISSKLLSTQLSLIYMDMVHNPFIPLLFMIVLLFFCRNLFHLVCQINKMLSSEPQAPVYFSYLWLACPIVLLASYPHNLSNSSFSSLFPAGLPRFFCN